MTYGTDSRDDSEPIYDFYTEFPKDHHYVEDLRTTPMHKPQVLVWLPSLTYLVYIHRVLKNVILTLMFEWTMPIFHPFNFLLLVTVFPTLIIVIIILEVALHIGLKFGLDTVIEDYSKKWGEGLSIVNWWDPRIFQSKVHKTVKRAIKALNSPSPPPLSETKLDDSIFGFEGTIQHRGFHLDIAELLLFMSCIIYERKDKIVRDARKSLNQIAKENNLSIKSEEKLKSISGQLKESENRIHEQANKWGLKFTSLSELNSLGGPFAGMFWSEEYDFIVVVFKGTTPSNFEDFVVDLLFQRIDARSFVYGDVHEGFYTSLFPQNEFSTTRSSRSSPYVTIIRAIRAKAADIKALRPEDKTQVNVWVTGHSLGAALASLFYARLIKAPGDLGPNCVLRDGYVFGSPSVGDSNFAAEFASYNNMPYDRQSTLWRIIDDVDIITKIPPGWNDATVKRVIDKDSILNYAHIGEGIKFFQNGDRPVSTINLFSSGKEPVIVEKDTESFGFFGWWYKSKEHGNDEKKPKHNFEEYKHVEGSPLNFIEKYLLPTFFRNHLPARYFAAMEKARVYFDVDIDEPGESSKEAGGETAIRKFEKNTG